MSRTTLSELLAFLASIGASPKKSLSQNFLIDGNIVKKIIREAEISVGDSVLEIGAGPGALTEALLNAGAQVIVVEKDRKFAAALRTDERLIVHEEDVMKFSLEELPKNTKVVSNLPYHLTTPILGRLVPRHDLFKSITVMVQDEVAKRMGAPPGTSEYSALTVFLNFYSYVKYNFFVSKHCFYPAPKVNSAMITLYLKRPIFEDASAFFQFVHRTFSKRRKMVKTSLGKEYGGSQVIEEALKQLGLNPLTRPESLSCEDFIALFLKISNSK